MEELKLATSRFHSADLIAASGLVPVGIVVSPPKWRLPYELAANLGVSSPRPARDRGAPAP